MEVLSAAVPDWLGLTISGSQASSWSGDPQFHGSNVTWALIATRAEAAPITSVLDFDNSHSRVSLASEHRAQCFPGHSRMLPGGGGESPSSYIGSVLQPVSCFILLPQSCLLNMMCDG